MASKLTIICWQACWGRNPSGGRNTSSKVAKQAALGFVKRTLERYHQFEDTGKSCFNEPLFKDMFFAASSQLSIVRLVDVMEAESAKSHASTLSLEARTGVLFIIFLNKWSNLLLYSILVFPMTILVKISHGFNPLTYVCLCNPLSTLLVPNAALPMKYCN
jgi:multisubunit Na+/H+ antiporter MnhG subunit